VYVEPSRYVVVVEPSGFVRVVVSVFSAGVGAPGWAAETGPLNERNKKAAANRLIMIENLGLRFIVFNFWGLDALLSPGRVEWGCGLSTLCWDDKKRLAQDVYAEKEQDQAGKNCVPE
jgi:hypothetical protein